MTPGTDMKLRIKIMAITREAIRNMVINMMMRITMTTIKRKDLRWSRSSRKGSRRWEKSPTQRNGKISKTPTTS